MDVLVIAGGIFWYLFQPLRFPARVKFPKGAGDTNLPSHYKRKGKYEYSGSVRSHHQSAYKPWQKMNHSELGSIIILRETSNERPFKNHGSLADIFMFTNAQGSLTDTIKELHRLTDRFYFYKTSADVSRADLNVELPLLMSHLMETKERAKRVYRSALTTKFSEHEWDMNQQIEELEMELLRTFQIFQLYPRRGGYY